MRVRHFPLQYNKNTKDFRFQTNLLLELSMHSEPSPQHQMSGNLPPRNREESREKYHEVVLENPGDLTMYTWAQMQALELLPGRVPANESGFHFPGVMRGITMELVQKRPFDYTYNQAMNMVKNYVIQKTVIHLNPESVYFSLGYEKNYFMKEIDFSQLGFHYQNIGYSQLGLQYQNIDYSQLGLQYQNIRYSQLGLHYQNIGYSQLGSHSQLVRKN